MTLMLSVAWSPALFFVIASTELGALLTAAMALHRVLHNYAQSSSTIGVGIIPIKKGALSLIVHLPSHANSQVALASLVCITTMYELARPRTLGLNRFLSRLIPSSLRLYTNTPF